MFIDDHHRLGRVGRRREEGPMPALQYCRRALPGSLLAPLSVLAIGLVAVVTAPAALAATGGSGPAAEPRASVTFDPTRTVGTLPADFTGLSFEASQLHDGGPHWTATKGNFAAMLRTLGTGQLRYGGNSLDRRTAWTPDGGQRPDWAKTGVTRGDLAKVAAFSTATGWRVLL